jgi:hypothetical protein
MKCLALTGAKIHAGHFLELKNESTLLEAELVRVATEAESNTSASAVIEVTRILSDLVALCDDVLTSVYSARGDCDETFCKRILQETPPLNPDLTRSFIQAKINSLQQQARIERAIQTLIDNLLEPLKNAETELSKLRDLFELYVDEIEGEFFTEAEEEFEREYGQDDEDDPKLLPFLDDLEPTDDRVPTPWYVDDFETDEQRRERIYRLVFERQENERERKEAYERMQTNIKFDASYQAFGGLAEIVSRELGEHVDFASNVWLKIADFFTTRSPPELHVIRCYELLRDLHSDFSSISMSNYLRIQSHVERLGALDRELDARFDVLECRDRDVKFHDIEFPMFLALINSIDSAIDGVKELIDEDHETL